MMSPVWLNTAAFWTLEDNLTFLEAHPLNIFFGSVSPGDGSGVGQHCANMRADGEYCEALNVDIIILRGISLIGDSFPCDIN